MLSAIGAMAIALLFGYAFSWFFALVGLLVRDPETAQVAGFVPLFPLVFASSIFVSPQTMPSWLRAFAEHQPITKVANAVRGLSLGTASTRDVVVALLWIAGMLRRVRTARHLALPPGLTRVQASAARRCAVDCSDATQPLRS